MVLLNNFSRFLEKLCSLANFRQSGHLPVENILGYLSPYDVIDHMHPSLASDLFDPLPHILCRVVDGVYGSILLDNVSLVITAHCSYHLSANF